MSFAELHFMHARLQGGRINKAKKGELRFRLPVGFCYDEKGRVRLDPDEQVRNTVHLFFNLFKEKGSAYGVINHLNHHHIQFPKRESMGALKGKLIWKTLGYSRAVNILKNPVYAGAYVYGQQVNHKRLSETGQLKKSSSTLPMEEWPIMLKDHHEGYISWEKYLDNQRVLRGNNSKEGNMLPSNAREGLALLQGLLVCGFCGHRLNTR